MRKPHLWIGWAALAASVSCRGCFEESGPQTPLELPAADTTAAFVVPQIGTLIAAVDAFTARATERAGATFVASLRESFKKALGFDPLVVEEYASLGIDPDGGAVVFFEGDAAEPLLALTVRDRRTFDRKLREIIQKTDGAKSFSEGEQHGFAVVHAGRPFGDEIVPAFHWAYVGRFVLIARADGNTAWQAALARLSQPVEGRQTLGSDGAYRALAQRVPAGMLRLFVRTDGLVGAEAAAASPAAITSITLGREGVSADTFVALEVDGLEAALATPPAGDLAGWLDDGAAVVVLSRAARPAGLAALRSHPQLAALADRGVSTLGAAMGLDPEREVLPLLAGPFAAAVHITDLAGLPQRLRARRSLQSLLDSFHIVMVAEVNDRAAFLAMLQRSRATLEKRGVALRQRERKVGEMRAVIFEPDREAPRIGWGLVDNCYVYAAGRGRIDRAIDAVADTGPSLADALAGTAAGELAGEEGTSVAVARLGIVAEAAGQLTLDRHGPGMGVAAILDSVVQLVGTLGDVVAAVDAEPGGLRLRVRERIR